MSTFNFSDLTPERILDAVESIGVYPISGLLPLNSYENRVYQVGIEESDPVVTKFYRPGRWSDQQILEEHRFSLELEAAEIPLIAPMVMDGETMKMEQIMNGIALPVGSDIALQPGGKHIMLMGLNDTLDAGKTFPLTLNFGESGSITVDFTVVKL